MGGWLGVERCLQGASKPGQAACCHDGRALAAGHSAAATYSSHSALPRCPSSAGIQVLTFLMGTNTKMGSRRYTHLSTRPNRSISGCSRCTRALSLRAQEDRKGTYIYISAIPCPQLLQAGGRCAQYIIQAFREARLRQWSASPLLSTCSLSTKPEPCCK